LSGMVSMMVAAMVKLALLESVLITGQETATLAATVAPNYSVIWTTIRDPEHPESRIETCDLHIWTSNRPPPAVSITALRPSQQINIVPIDRYDSTNQSCILAANICVKCCVLLCYGRCRGFIVAENKGRLSMDKSGGMLRE
jgi:hypothetical protein